MPIQTTDFWHFATTVYGYPEIEGHCLWLQDKRNADIVMLLFCLWAGYRVGTLPQDALEQLNNNSETWQDAVVRPLRSARRWLKLHSSLQPGEAIETLRATIKDDERQAEALQAQLLIQWLADLALPPATPGESAAKANLRTYCRLRGIGSDEDSTLRLNALLAGAKAWSTGKG